MSNSQSSASTSRRWEGDELRWSALMAKSQQGDEHAYQQLLAELYKALTLYLRVNFGYLIAIEDCVQECLIAIHKARHTYNPAKPFRPWMFTIAKHKTIDILRSQAKHKNNDSLDQMEASDRIELEAQQGAVIPSDINDAAKLLQQLTAEHREILLLTQYQGFTSLEAAQQLNISESAAKARLRRGLAAVKQLWLKQSYDL